MSQDQKDKQNSSQSTAVFAGFIAVFRAVLWSFFGVRRSDHHTHDMQNLNPVHVILVGVIAAVLFVVTLILIVKMVVS